MVSRCVPPLRWKGLSKEEEGEEDDGACTSARPRFCWVRAAGAGRMLGSAWRVQLRTNGAVAFVRGAIEI